MIAKKLIVAFLIMVSVYSFIEPGIKEDKEAISSADSTLSLLALYGKHIFFRDSCGSCHSMLSDEKSSAVSLDGLAGKYSFEWHYSHLEDPRTVMMGSKMPSYAYLIDKPIDKQIFDQLMISRFGTSLPNKSGSLWLEMNREADSILTSLKKSSFIPQHKNEMLALIIYLQQIPSSPIKLKQDSIFIAKHNEHMQVWKNLILDSNSTLIKTALNKDKRTIKNGKFIYQHNCVACHGKFGEGIIGPNLTDDYWLYGGTVVEIAQIIINGAPRGMKSWKFDLTPVQVGELISYISSLKGTNPENAKEKQGKKE